MVPPTQIICNSAIRRGTRGVGLRRKLTQSCPRPNATDSGRNLNFYNKKKLATNLFLKMLFSILLYFPIQCPTFIKKHNKIIKNILLFFSIVCFQMLGTFLGWFLDEISAYALDFWFEERHWQYFAVRRRKFYLKIIAKTWLTFGNALYVCFLDKGMWYVRSEWK